MIKIENYSVYNMCNAIRGMRNPLESWGNSDTHNDILGEKDLILAKKLISAGTDHSKFMRQIFVSMDITAPMTWWWDFDTYKVATVKNSTSRMHKLGSRLLTLKDFSWGVATEMRLRLLHDLNQRIAEFQRTKDMELWRSIIDDLPQSYNFLATWTGNYQVLRSVYHSRKNHKQVEFREFCKFIEEELPYGELISMEG